MGIVQEDNCNFCNTDHDSVLHYMWQCEYTQSFWKDFVNCLKEKCTNCAYLTLNVNLVLFGYDEGIKTDNGFDFVLLQAKYFVYKCHIGRARPTIKVFLNLLQYIYKTDRYVHHIEMRPELFIKKWAPYSALVC